MSEATLLRCPIRGQLQVPQKARDGLTYTEEKRRIDAIRFLLHRGYPPEHFGIEKTLLRFGNQGRNSFRVDFSIYHEPWSEVAQWPVEERLPDTLLVAEIKRDNAASTEAIATQVKPALGFLPDLRALGVYWDDVEQRFFYRELEGTFTATREAPISKIPKWREEVGSTQLTYADLDSSFDLTVVFNQLEDSLHPYVTDKSRRYSILFQLLIAKIWDETKHSGEPDSLLHIQDFSATAVMDNVVLERMNACLREAADHYSRFLPESIDRTFTSLGPEALRRLSQVLAPVNILSSRQQVIQAFYMKFAQNLYKWDLAQYFTPHEVVSFIVNLTNPRLEHVKDPACGSADFLVSALRAMPTIPTKAAEFLAGTDNSPQAVQVSVLNMMLQGDGKSAIEKADSLERHPRERGSYDVVLCNPPFGTKITEKRWEVLRNFDMGHYWNLSEHGIVRTDDVRRSQQTGILFVELCVRLAKPGGRVGIILPNGYLGNASPEYVALREWLLRHTRVVAIVAFPRFTFKKSGADVSASAIILERRSEPLVTSSSSEDYPIYFGMIESVGWRAGDKKAVPIYKRDPQTGDLLLDENNDPMLDSDFGKILEEFRRSPVSSYYSWILRDQDIPSGPQSPATSSREIIMDEELILDPKRFCGKFRKLQTEIRSGDHFRIGDILSVVDAPPLRPEKSQIYRYVEIEDMRAGAHDFKEIRGWKLPGRAKLVAEPGDVFIAHIWGCAGKWFIATREGSQSLVITNGCTRFRPHDDRRDLLPDLVAGLCSELFAVQMRALARGSDGLAQVPDEDILSIVLPRVVDNDQRQRLQILVDDLMDGSINFAHSVRSTVSTNWPTPPNRKSHCALV